VIEGDSSDSCERIADDFPFEQTLTFVSNMREDVTAASRIRADGSSIG
jgi:hypothetical protein